MLLARTRILVGLTFVALAPAVAKAQPTLFERWREQGAVRSTAELGCGDVGTQSSGALYQICTPTVLPWNGDLVVYAHGYAAPSSPLAIPSETDLFGGFFILTGRAFAVTSFRANGLAVLDAVEDLRELVAIFSESQGAPARVYLLGASQGALIATLALENEPETYDGALAMCGPVGSFAAQIDYFGDFRVIFDFLYPGLLPASPVVIPESLIAGWADHYASVVQPALTASDGGGQLDDLLALTGAASDAADPATRETTASGLLWYNVFATNEGSSRLGGQPFDNTTRTYQGSSQDDAVNAGVERFAGESVARAEIAEHYETAGRLDRPLVTLHTTLDEIVPYWHAPRYEEKVAAEGGAALHDHVAVERYGHCNFDALEIFEAFNRLVALVDAQNP